MQPRPTEVIRRKPAKIPRGRRVDQFRAVAMRVKRLYRQQE